MSVELLKQLVDELLSRMQNAESREIFTAVLYLITNLPLSKLEILGLIEIAKIFIFRDESVDVNYIR